MMREIKFRAQRVDNGEWVKGYLLTRSDGKTFIVKECDLESYDGDNTSDLLCIDWYEVIPETVGQYTGLKDKNGVEIYEGDILACGEGNVPTEIKWEQESCAYMAYNLKRKEYHLLNKYFERFIGKIIGNIHDNPELLEVQGGK